MIGLDRNALICDLAEVYHIFDYHGVPVRLLGTLCTGLGPNTRIGMKLAGTKVPLETILLARIIDFLQLSVWTIGGQKGKEPISYVELLTGTIDDKEIVGVSTPEEFEAKRAEILKRLQDG